jgi:hypothetical protein
MHLTKVHLSAQRRTVDRFSWCLLPLTWPSATAILPHLTNAEEAAMRLLSLVLFLGLAFAVTSVSVFGSGPTGDPVLDALWGKDITVRELTGAAPAGASEKMLNTKVHWGGPGITTVVAHYVGPEAVAGAPTSAGSDPSRGGLGLLRLPLIVSIVVLFAAVLARSLAMRSPVGIGRRIGHEA